MQDTKHTYTHLEADEELPRGLYICNDCGSSAPIRKEVRHYPNCKPGDAARWAEFYNQQEEKTDGT